MDQDLIAYLDKRFGETAKHIDTLRQETAEQISGLREETTAQIKSLRQETAERFEAVEGAIRQTHVVVEGLRGDIRLLAEGWIGTEEKAQVFRNEVSHMDRRVLLLEERAARDRQAPIDLLRERYSKKPDESRTGFEGRREVAGLFQLKRHRPLSRAQSPPRHPGGRALRAGRIWAGGTVRNSLSLCERAML